jgi:hypothetical protein
MLLIRVVYLRQCVHTRYNCKFASVHIYMNVRVYSWRALSQGTLDVNKNNNEHTYAAQLNKPAYTSESPIGMVCCLCGEQSHLNEVDTVLKKMDKENASMKRNTRMTPSDLDSLLSPNMYVQQCRSLWLSPNMYVQQWRSLVFARWLWCVPMAMAMAMAMFIAMAI